MSDHRSPTYRRRTGDRWRRRSGHRPAPRPATLPQFRPLAAGARKSTCPTGSPPCGHHRESAVSWFLSCAARWGVRVAGTGGRQAHRPTGPVGGRSGHEQGLPTGLAVGQDRHRGPTYPGAVRHRPAWPVGEPDADVHQRGDRRDPAEGQDLALRELLLIAGLDPRAEALLRPESTGDLRPLVCIAHRYRSGDDEDIDYALADMRAPCAPSCAAAPRSSGNYAGTCARRTRSPPTWPTPAATAASSGHRGVDECQVWSDTPNTARSSKT
jgi:hypothetical protein